MVRGQWGNLSIMPGLHPYSFSKDILEFLMTTESQDLGLTSHSKDGAFYSIVSPSLLLITYITYKAHILHDHSCYTSLILPNT